MGDGKIDELLNDSLFTEDEIERYVSLDSSILGRVRTEEEDRIYQELFRKRSAIEEVIKALSEKPGRTSMEKEMLEAYSASEYDYKVAFYRAQSDDELLQYYNALRAAADLPEVDQIGLKAIREVMREKGISVKINQLPNIAR